MSGWLAQSRIGKSHYDEYFGDYEISSGAEVQEEGVAGSYEVVLLLRRELRALARTVSATDGSYRFQYLADHPSGYVLMAFDHGASPVTPAISDTPVLTKMVLSF